MTRIQLESVQTPTTIPVGRCRAFKPVVVPDRIWPAKHITKAPRWLSTDLHDGSQAPIDLMTPDRRMRVLELLVALGYKEMEIDFPSTSQTNFDFVRQLITDGHVPEDVTIPVLTQAREDLIARIAESLIRAHRATIHMCNATAELFRRVVLNTDETECVSLAMRGTELVMEYTDKYLGEVEFGYQCSPEIFTQTPADFAVEACNAVAEIWQPGKSREIIFNLSATVERSAPNTYADQIEYFCRNINSREFVAVLLHPYNNRGTVVATAELGQVAGAGRVKGYLFGHDKHTGSVDLMTLALSLYTQGVDPQLDFYDIDHVCRTVEYCTDLPTHPRQSYAGDLVYTVFSGSHQDAIKKGLESLEKQAAGTGRPITEIEWEAPYLPIDPHDVGQNYEAVIRVNSQSDKGGVAYLMRTKAKMELPRRLRMEFGRVVQQRTDVQGGELSPKGVVDIFSAEYLSEGGWTLTPASSSSQNGQFRITTTINDPKGRGMDVEGEGNGPVPAFVDALAETGTRIRVLGYSEYVLESGGDAKVAAYVECELGAKDGTQVFWGIGVDPSITSASVKTIPSALNRIARV